MERYRKTGEKSSHHTRPKGCGRSASWNQRATRVIRPDSVPHAAADGEVPPSSDESRGQQQHSKRGHRHHNHLASEVTVITSTIAGEVTVITATRHTSATAAVDVREPTTGRTSRATLDKSAFSTSTAYCSLVCSNPRCTSDVLLLTSVRGSATRTAAYHMELCKGPYNPTNHNRLCIADRANASGERYTPCSVQLHRG